MKSAEEWAETLPRPIEAEDIRRVQADARAELVEFLDKMLHDGANGRSSKASPDCWPDCLRCKWEKMAR
jgi:hypothetical protein